MRERETPPGSWDARLSGLIMQAPDRSFVETLRSRCQTAQHWAAIATAFTLPISTSGQAIAIAVFAVLTLATLDFWSRQRLASAAVLVPILIVIIMIAGIAWSPLPLAASAKGVSPYLKLLLIPLLFATRMTERQVQQIMLAFLAGCTLVMVLSYTYFALPTAWMEPYRAKKISESALHIAPGLTLFSLPGVPFKDNTIQGGCFALCLFGLGYHAHRFWMAGRRGRAAVSASVAFAFFINMFVITTSKTGLIIVTVLLALLLFHASRTARLRYIVLAAFIMAAIAASALVISGQVRARFVEFKSNFATSTVPPEAAVTQVADISTSLRLDFWTKGWQLLQERPLLGHGTGTILTLYQREAAERPSPDGSATPDPHNQLLHIALQTGALGAALLVLMWLSHLKLFLGYGFVKVLGQAVVLQAIIGCLFNSHLATVTQGMIYCCAVGLLGSAVRRAAILNQASA